jgi:EAL domain-containing protein (putative c-di-GMP-specific phosphodiesterase class I)
MRVLAEGVETTGQLDFLRRHGCNEYQGYLFARPQAADAVVALLSKVEGPTLKSRAAR